MERRVRGQREKRPRLPPSYRWLERMEVCEGGSQKFVEKLREIVHAARGRLGPDPQEITDKNLAQVNWWHSLLLIVCWDHPLVVFALGVANMVC